ncbi:hypothetical protein [Paraburkholderia tagetis]|uniref:Uncharacterized protein n=1 Tax=Paraburkholderia tagetis TaxID=2913261 RepID=A0A9X1ULE4_9BURK|nr:hypothetical protein [Paraburkholderia tagetis]MCG5077517.1 hypothetical protein [Paraburkholderia tagetis]
MSNRTPLTYEVKLLNTEDPNEFTLGDLADHTSRTEEQVDMFVVPAWTMLESTPHCDGQDCIVVSLSDMSTSDVMNGSHDVCAGVVSWFGRYYPCLMMNDGLIGIDAETVLDAHIEVDEPLLIVFDCEDGCVLTMANFTAQLENQLKAIVEAKDFLPTAKVGDDGRSIDQTKYAALNAAYYGFA